MTEHATAVAGFDAESAEWLRALASTGPRREEALARLHGLLVPPDNRSPVPPGNWLTNGNLRLAGHSR